jgi:hypothetical protein
LSDEKTSVKISGDNVPLILHILVKRAKVGEVPTFRASDTDTDHPIVSANLFHGFQYLKNRFIASK